MSELKAEPELWAGFRIKGRNEIHIDRTYLADILQC